MNARELAMRMADDASGIAQHLLPKGKRCGPEWKAGSTAGEEGESLSIRISGAKKGIWKDFAADVGGDLLDLWAAVRGLSMSEAMAEAKAHLGVRDHMPPRDRPTYRRPERPRGQAAKSAVREWLNGRGITDATIEDFKIAEQTRDGKHIAVFPYLRGGELVNVKYRDIADKRGMRQESGAEPCLFGWHLIDPRVRSIAITEGEIDAMTLHQCGIPALSVNAGAGNHQWIESDWERLDRFSEIYICFDDDDAGKKGAAEVAQRLGIERCRLATFPAKDANQYLQDGAGGEDFHAALKTAKLLDPEELVSVYEFMRSIRDLGQTDRGPEHPILQLGTLHDESIQFRPGELTVWTGFSGHGKTLMLGQVLLGLMQQGQRVCVFSGEMAPVQQAKRLARQCSGSQHPTPGYVDVIAEWLRDRMWIFNVVGSARIVRLCEVFGYAARRYGVSHVVVDSLMTTDVPEDGPNALTKQKEAMQALTALAKARKLHVHLVAHPRKQRDESGAPGKLDVAGSSKLTDTADNVVSVWSARKDESTEDNGKPDALFELHKQRNGDVQHTKHWLYFNRAAMQYTPRHDRRPMQIVPFERAAQKEVM